MEQERETGVPVGVGTTEGADKTGAVTVTLSQTHRVVAVRLCEGENVRTPEALERTFAEACSAALTAQLETARGDRPKRAPGQRPKPLATRLTVRRPTTEQLTRHRIRAESRLLPRARTGDAVGVSANECVRVTLPPAQPIGAVAADAGWLANASLDNVAKAITEAFRHAYSKKDNT